MKGEGFGTFFVCLKEQGSGRRTCQRPVDVPSRENFLFSLFTLFGVSGLEVLGLPPSSSLLPPSPFVSMSSRPAGPSTRPFPQSISFPLNRQSSYAYEPILPTNLPFQLADHDAPRLRERGLLSRMLHCISCIGCIGLVLFLFYLVFNAAFPDLLFGTEQTFSSSSSSSSSLKQTNLKKQLHQKSIIKRLSMLKRSGSGSGVDLKSVKQLFPHWVAVTEAGEETFRPENVLGELIMAMSFLSQVELEE